MKNLIKHGFISVIMVTFRLCFAGQLPCELGRASVGPACVTQLDFWNNSGQELWTDSPIFIFLLLFLGSLLSLHWSKIKNNGPPLLFFYQMGRN